MSEALHKSAMAIYSKLEAAQKEIKELRKALAAHEAAPQQEPVAWVDERAIGWLKGRGKSASITTPLQAHKSSERPMALYAAPQQAQAPGWQPIETAPKDGTEFWGWRPHGRVQQGVAYRVPRDDCEMWHFAGSSANVDIAPDLKPTHWMPLPAAPQQGSKT